MRAKLYYSFLVLLVGSLAIIACDTTNTENFEDSIEVFTGLEAIPGASNSTMIVNDGNKIGADSYFQVQIDNVENNSFLKPGTYGAWCLEWKKPLRSNNDQHEGVKWYTTHNSEKWKPLNYLFLVRDQLENTYPDLNIYDIQAAVWTLAGDMGIAPEFDVDVLTASELPSDVVSGGAPKYDKTKVKAIVQKVMSEYSSLNYKFMSEHSSGSAGETEGEEQDVFVPGDPADPCDEDIVDFNKIDVMLLFDDTGSFAGRVPTIAALFPDIIDELETTFPDKDFAFGVSRFEDYGGPGTGFSGENTTGRPFILNQPLVTILAAGGTVAQRNTLIQDALGRTGPGFGGDGPETPLHALYELATGNGFDGDGDGNTTGSGDAGSTAAQTSPETSGDIPAFETNVLPTSGTLGGAGWRTDAQKIVIVATDVCNVSAFDAASGVPTEIDGQPGAVEAIAKFACSSTSPGVGRFGFISDAKSTTANTVSGAVVPSGAPSVQQSVDALTSLGIQVIGLSTTAPNPSDPGPSFSPHVFLGAMANLTGAVDDSGNPLVFQIGSSADIAAGIVDAVGTSACDATAETAIKISNFTDGLRKSSVADDDTTRYSNYVIFE